MHTLTKKRLKAYMIDFTAASAITLWAEQLLRKKIKNEAFHALMTPTVAAWGLEYMQLKRNGQTLGYKHQGLVLESEQGVGLTSAQIMRRMVYRDTIGPLIYWKDRQELEEQNGEQLPQDRYAGTVVREIGK